MTTPTRNEMTDDRRQMTDDGEALTILIKKELEFGFPWDQCNM